MKISDQEKKTLHLLIFAGFLNGFVMSLFQIQDIVAKKALHAADWQITLLVMLWPLSNLFSIWWGKILENSHSLAKYFILTAFVGRLILIFMLFVHNYYQYLAILTVIFSFNALLSPAQNSIYQHNITSKNRGRFFGFITSLTTLIMISTSYTAGRILDINESYFRYIFALIGVFGCLGMLSMSMIKLKKNEQKGTRNTERKSYFEPLKRSLEVLKKNKNFATFQRNYFLYGIAFMILLPSIPKYLVEYLHMSYTQTFIGKAIISQLGILLLSPLAGKIHDKKNPALFTTVAFGLLGLYPLTLFISSFFIGHFYANYIVYLAFLFFGIAMSAIVISWNISSIYFAGAEDVSMYQSIHVSLTGLRGIVIPIFGFLILKFFGIKVVFVIAFCFFLLASFLSFQLYKRMNNEKILNLGQ